MLKLTSKPFTGCVLCNLLIHMQNNSLRSSQMCRIQNFKVVFGFKSGTAVLTFPFHFLLLSSFPGHLIGFISEDKIVYCDASNEILQKDVLLSYKQFFTYVLLSDYSVNLIFSNCLHGCLIIMRALLSLNLQNIFAYFFSAMKRTTRGFDAKGNCSARTYEYLTPTYAFAKDYVSHPQSSSFY